jgi:hypothetical protein
VSRLARFEDYRFIGIRDSMRVYDCDDVDQFAELEKRAEGERLLQRTMLQAFSPDTVAEALNRGFSPIKG